LPSPTSSPSSAGRFGDDVSVTENAGVDISYLVFNPSDQWSGKLAVRKAVAQVVDRAAIADHVYADTVEPLYSMVPAGLPGHTPSYFDGFGGPSAAKARKILTDAGIGERVPLTFWYTTDRYGSETALAAHRDISGTQRALDPSSIMMMWELAHDG
jgi:peptide/nickel transport system substrate-binding protein